MEDIRRTFHEHLEDVQNDIVRLAAMATEAIPAPRPHCSTATSRPPSSSSTTTMRSTSSPWTSRNGSTT